MTLRFLLWILSLVAYGGALYYLLCELRGPYAIDRWQRTLTLLFGAVACLAVQRTLALGYVWGDLNSEAVFGLSALLGLFGTIGLCLGFRSMAIMFHGSLRPLPPPHAIIDIDAFSVIMAWDRTAEEFFGFAATEALGKTLMETIIPPRYWEAHRAAMARLLATHIPGTPFRHTVPTAARTKAGGELTVEIVISILSGTTPEDLRFRGSVTRLVIL